MARESKVAARNRWMFEMMEKAMQKLDEVEVSKRFYGSEWIIGVISDSSITSMLLEEVI